MQYDRKGKNRGVVLFEQGVLVLLFGFALSLFVLVAGLFAHQFMQAERIYPGVSLAGTDVSGLDLNQATARVFEQVTYPQTGRILFKYGDSSWLASPAELGLFLDAQTTAQKAFSTGRSGNLLQRLINQYNLYLHGIDIPPVMIFDQNLALQYLSHLAGQIDQPVIEASLDINGTDVVVQQGQVGHTLNISSTMAQITAQLEKLQDGIITIVVDESVPHIMDASQQAGLARQILSQPLTLALPEGETGGGPWTFDKATLASMLSFDLVNTAPQDHYQLNLDSNTLYEFLLSLEPELYLTSDNTRFMFNDDTRQLEVVQPATIGRTLDVDASLQSIRDTLLQGGHEVTLQITHHPPAVTDDMTGEELGVTELIHEETSYFYGSDADRVQNITAAANSFYGLMVAPGEEFSMAQALGDITLDNGYAEALIILGGQTIKGVGGGVCQVSTTLFRAAFFSGFPITERHQHAYRVGYYEKLAGNRRDPSLAGLDATVFVPLVDMKFVNDTPYWLLMETYVNPTYSSIIWKFYSTSDGRTVDWDTTGPVNIVEPPDTLYRENPDLPKGEVKQVDYQAQGADVTVNRRVYKDGSLYFEDTFFTHYQPWQAIYEYGPGTEGMPPPEDEDQPKP
jgi:vancomycin resistance protein YoaR